MLASHTAPQRPPAVAGLFYPAPRAALQSLVEELLAGAQPAGTLAQRPRALIVPHAGYIYSGAVAAAAYAALGPWRDDIRRVVLLGPPHRVAVRRAAAPTAGAFLTPLGAIPVDQRALATLRAAGHVVDDDLAHRDEHALEVQLPFLQAMLERFELVPLLVGAASPSAIADWLEPFWAMPDTLVVVSTDLSHYHPYAEAERIDAATDDAILGRADDRIGPEQACGCHALNGLLHLARRLDARIERLARCNSGDTAGSRARVVGYAAYVLR